MSQEFNASSKTTLTRDAHGEIRDVLHVEEPYVSNAATPLLAARDYLEKHGALVGVEPAHLARFARAAGAPEEGAGVEYRFLQEKPQFDTTTVVFEQTYLGLPVWGAGLAVHMTQKPFTVIGAQSSRHASVSAAMPSEEALRRALKLDAATLARSLGVHDTKDCDAKALVIKRTRLVVYRYEAAERMGRPEPTEPAGQAGAPAAALPGRREHLHPELKLPPTGERMVDGRHYVAVEVTFNLPWRGIEDLHWIALLEVESLVVLYVRALIDDVNGLVFVEDPVTANGGPMPNATAAALDAVRTSVLLPELAPPVAGTVALTGDTVTVRDVEVPTVAPPTRPAGSPFDFSSRTNHFAAVNAYYHCTRFFDLVAELGFDLPTYFTGTLFPSIVDHRGRFGTANGIEINAYCLGNGTFGIARTAFMLADLTDTVNPIGLACDWRVVLHELGGHGILYNHVNFANFGFAHSAGDSFAAVLNDPDSRAGDRFLTFPWIGGVIPRRHDRAVGAGWAWGGVFDLNGYFSEQILCTTHFRLYRSIGGDSAELAERRYASRYVAYLILRTVGSLTQATNPGSPDAYANALMAAERGNWTSEGEVGAVYGKVVRWAFEKQGLYQPAGTPKPIWTEGAPPPVDVYIDDGRHGEYTFLPDFWETHSIWNRVEPDGKAGHQTPLVCRKNYAYVRVKNRGTLPAKAARVSGYHCRPSAGLVWPDDFEPMTTASLAVPELAPAAEVVIGPFEWTPVHPGHECMLMSVSAPADRANNDPVTGLSSAAGPTPVWRLVPNDNNLGLRALIPVPGGGGRCALEEAFCNRKFWAQNPNAKPARMEVRAVLPPFLASRGWAMRFDNPGGGHFTLGARDVREIRPVLESGRDFTAGDLSDAAPVTIVVQVLANGIVVGGLTFVLDPDLKQAAPERAPCRDHKADDEDCRRARRCCEPCIDDRCQPCCAPCETEEKHDRDDACGDPGGEHPQRCDEDDKDCGASRPGRIRIEINLDAHGKPIVHKHGEH